MSKPFPKFCIDCKHSTTIEKRMGLWCMNAKVNGKDPYALSGETPNDTNSGCPVERGKEGWFSVCGIKGKQWEPK